MDNIFIKEAPTTPEIRFDFEEGVLEIKGVSIPEDTDEFYSPVHNALEEYLSGEKPPEEITVYFKLIYVNTSTIAVLGKMIKALETSDCSVNVKWYYEMEDDDMKDLGEDFSSFSNLQFEMIPCQEIS